METTAVRRRNRRGEGGQLREEIVRAALDLLAETGDAQAVTLRAVARRIGIAAPSIYAHFPDRESILLAAVREQFGELRAYLREAVDRAPAEPVDRLVALCVAYLEFARTRPRHYLVMFGGTWVATQAIEDGLVERAEILGLGQDTLADLTALLADCVAAGRSTSTDPAADATVLWVALHGLAHQRIVSAVFDWPADVDTRLITRLAHLAPDTPVRA